MNTFPLTITSPDGALFDGEALGLFVRGIEGDLAVLAGHIPFITSVRAGDVHVDLPDGSTRYATTEGGLLTVAPDQVTLLASHFVWKD